MSKNYRKTIIYIYIYIHSYSIVISGAFNNRQQPDLSGGLPYEERGTMFGLAPRLGHGWRGEKTAGDHAPWRPRGGLGGWGWV